MTFSLLDLFQQQATKAHYKIDAIQQQAIDELNKLALLLCSSKNHKALPSFYIWGPVGRGKSWLVNTFYEAIPIKEKKRFHFHTFFKQLHHHIFQYASHQDSMKISLDILLEDCKLVCFDEFHVHDITNAMLIMRLFIELFNRKIALVTTSNYPPQGLLPNPLYHERFLPAIKLIEKHMTLIAIAGEIDYRTLPQANKQGFTTGYYIYPATSSQRQTLNLSNYTAETTTIKVINRILNPVFYNEQAIAFNFPDLCEGNTAVMDYLTLTEQFDTWIIDDLPPLSTTTIGAQQRFINLIDILYDQNKCLYLLAHKSLAETLANAAIGDIVRTQSRLSQLQKC